MAESQNLVENEQRGDDIDLEMGGSETSKKNSLAVSDRAAYCEALRLWIRQAQMYHNLSNCFPYYMMTFQGLSAHPPHPAPPLLNNNYQFQAQEFGAAPPFTQRPPNDNNVPVPEAVNGNEVIALHGGFEYVIPSLTKRALAETVDFVLLFVFKLFITLVAVDVFDIIDLSKFDFNKFADNYEDYKYALDLTTEILFFEIIFKVMTCIYEAFCLSGSMGRVGGATPGKALLGLRVITATAILPVEGRERETVILYPGTALTFGTSLLRALLKTFLISLLFPICVIFFVFRHNRTGYDLLCGVIVVEENIFPQRRNAP